MRWFLGRGEVSCLSHAPGSAFASRCCSSSLYWEVELLLSVTGSTCRWFVICCNDIYVRVAFVLYLFVFIYLFILIIFICTLFICFSWLSLYAFHLFVSIDCLFCTLFVSVVYFYLYFIYLFQLIILICLFVYLFIIHYIFLCMCVTQFMICERRQEPLWKIIPQSFSFSSNIECFKKIFHRLWSH